MRKKIALALLCVFLLWGLSGCVGSRTTTKEKRTAESQLREATVENKQTEKREATTAGTNTESSEKRNIVIEFTKVDYYPEERKQPNRFTGQFQKADSVFNEEVRKTLEEAIEESAWEAAEKTKGNLKKAMQRGVDFSSIIEKLKDKSKPPNVKSKITGRIVINGDKQETTEAKATTNKDETTTEATTTTTEEDTKVTAQSQEKKRPKISPILWLLIGCGLITVVFGGFYVRNKFLKK